MRKLFLSLSLLVLVGAGCTDTTRYVNEEVYSFEHPNTVDVTTYSNEYVLVRSEEVNLRFKIIETPVNLRSWASSEVPEFNISSALAENEDITLGEANSVANTEIHGHEAIDLYGDESNESNYRTIIVQLDEKLLVITQDKEDALLESIVNSLIVE